MQPYGDNLKHLKTHLGILAKNGEQVPLIYPDWRDVPKDILDYIWKEVEVSVLYLNSLFYNFDTCLLYND